MALHWKKNSNFFDWSAQPIRCRFTNAVRHTEKLCSPSQQMQTSAYFHQLIIHGSSDWSLTAGSTVSFSRFFYSSSPEVLNFSSSFILFLWIIVAIGNVATTGETAWADGTKMAGVTSHDAQAKDTLTTKKHCAALRWRKSLVHVRKWPKKQMPVENVLQPSHPTHQRRSQLWAQSQKKMPTSVQNGFETNLNIPFDSSWNSLSKVCWV